MDKNIRLDVESELKNMEIPEYKTFKEKSKNFNLVRIDNIKDFSDICENHKKLKGIYRGVNSSSFKIFTSKQREYFFNTNNKDYLESLKANKYLQEYFRLAEIPKTDLSYYSILQHYGKPTPLIDFTNNFSVALFFALDSINWGITKNASELDNYFSLFFISDSDIELIDATSQLKEAANYNNISHDYFKNYEDYSYDKSMQTINRRLYINSKDVYFLKHDESFKKIVNINNNHRILMQEGVFVHNDLKQYPLEEALKEFLKEEIELNRYSPWDDMDHNKPDVQDAIQQNMEYSEQLRKTEKKLNENIITSFEINKKIVNDIERVIFIPDKDFIYFDIKESLDNL